MHLEHGVRRYGGLVTIENAGIKAEYLLLSYTDEAKLYVPVSGLHLISRYVGGGDESAPLYKLSNDVWYILGKKQRRKSMM